eukprot:symbB.v1.2.039646.t1/scaffold6701.1/size16094/3
MSSWVLRIGLGAHQEHRVNHEARAADRTKVSAEVIQLAAHEVDPEPNKAESDGGTSDSEGSESASDSEQNDPPSSLAADAEQYELMQTSYVAVGKDFHDQEVEGERKRPSSGLARVAAHPRPPKKRKPSASGTRFCDWIGGICYADTLQVWFPAHWAPVVLQQLQHKEDSYRAENPSWMDQEEAPADIRKQWQEARANRRMQFKVGNYRDGDRESNIRMLTGTIKADWIQLPVERYLAALPTLRHGVIAGVFRNKGAAPWGITRAEKLQLSVFLPNDLSLDDWYAGVYALPTVWPEASMLGADYLRKVAGYDFHLLRKKYDVQSMWGDLDPQWRLLKSQLETKGPGWYSPAEREERLFTNKSNRPGDDMKEALRTDGNTAVWQAWSTTQNQLRQLRQPAPPLVFPGEQEIFRAMYAQVGEEEQVISPPYTRTQLDASMRGRKKRKQGEDNALIG